jgi:squalene-hopene/tetraprenyl-beta-curcumene cyclase
MEIRRLDDALDRATAYVLSSQQPDGTWSGSVESDPRVTAFYLSTIWNLGLGPDDETREMEFYLSSKQLDCGAWQAWPGGPPDVDVTIICALALQIADTETGRRARKQAQNWLCGQTPPDPDSFWRGLLALYGYLTFADLPYLTPRIVSNPDWLHPNIYDFSFLRIAIVSASLLQNCPAHSPVSGGAADRSLEDEEPAFTDWKDRWIAECRKPLRSALPVICGLMRLLDRALPIGKHSRMALDWLLRHQESDGSFFSSVHMTSIAIVTLHRVDPSRHEGAVQSGLAAMRRWQRTDGRLRWQQFTDSTTWDTILFLDLLRLLGLPSDHPQIENARTFVVTNQVTHCGDWSHRTHRASGGGWGFQRVGRWYPDNDDAVMAVGALLNFETDDASDVVRRGIQWLLAMQSSSGGWASWDRNDRAWIQIPGGGPWFARDLDCAEITARIVTLFSRIAKREYRGLDDLIPAVQIALQRGVRWLERNSDEGIWFGRWFTHYLYGTSQVLEAYRELGYGTDCPEVQTAVNWVMSSAKADGGFGEETISGCSGRFISAPSTPFHTACGLIALVHGGASGHPTAKRAANWLLDNQDERGSWTNSDFFAAGVPGLWYANFELTPTYFAAKSLLMLKRSLTGHRARMPS